jgi:predicted nucleotide-binding protein
MSTSALDQIRSLREDLRNIAEGAPVGIDTTVAFERARRWHERAVRQLRESVSEQEAERLKNTVLRSFLPNPRANLDRMLQMYDAVLSALAEEVERDPSFLKKMPAQDPNPSTTPTPRATNPRKVFIVHGHDEANTHRLQSMLRDRFKLEPIVMAEAPGQGRALIEKFEQLADQCAFAFVLLTPDDEVSAGGGEYTQARPNVVFELGWLYGRLGRERVVMLLREGTRIHSDLDGVSRIQFIRSVEEKIIDIERELMAARIPVFGASATA